MNYFLLRRMFVLCATCTLFLVACESTPEQDKGSHCKDDANQTCVKKADNGEDRGYNPCLVNKNLPVCKK